jgi:hypothetical protein
VQVSNFVILVSYWAVLLYLMSHGMARQAFCFVLIPRAVSELFLAYSFDYVPHCPHSVTRRVGLSSSSSRCSGASSGLVQ